ncbi:MAG: primosomal protein N' [Clostridia bacterium]|nr:primosomal protein N' [Clostridia bacterium]
MYARVIVDIAHGSVDKIFEYSCEDSVKAGCRVKVPFGGRVIDGFVMEVSDKSEYPPSKIKPVSAVYDEPPALVPECFSLMQSMAKRYRVPKAVVLRLFIPSEMRLGKVREIYKKRVKFISDIPLSKSAAKQKQFLEFLQAEKDVDYTISCDQFGRGAVNSVIEKGGGELYRVRVNRSPLGGEEEREQGKTLTPAQVDALNSIKSSVQTVQLIHGVTGSGKTEIYLNAIAAAVKQGKTAIFLVPEISLTPQMLSQLRRRFGGGAAILHSGLSAGERFDEWWRLRTGEARIAIGARSAIFAPLENLGVIIIDEEHDSSYFSESSPRYSTLDIAKMRAEYNGCKLILGSATPSVESYALAKKGEYNLITLTERINGRPMPEIEIADMRKEVKRGNNSAFSQALRDELKDTLDGGRQAIIFLNRRGYSHTVICQECGYVATCEHCDVSLAYHSEENCLKCHYCGTKYRMPKACPECGGLHLRYGGTGTQKVVADLKSAFPQARILRMDNDTTSGKEGHYKILKSFGDHKADILVGTQMIAKGHDFPSVTLVGILDADMSLHFSDYRAGERTFQLITQVSGRSGRAGEAGRVVLQTSCPENYILRYAVNYDYEGFFNNEIALRETTQFPPFSLIVRVMVTAEEDRFALEALKKVWFDIDGLRQNRPEKFIFLNKMHSPIKKIQGKVRYQVLMRLTDDGLLEEIYDISVKHSSDNALVYVEENPANLS